MVAHTDKVYNEAGKNTLNSCYSEVKTEILNVYFFKVSSLVENCLSVSVCTGHHCVTKIQQTIRINRFINIDIKTK